MRPHLLLIAALFLSAPACADVAQPVEKAAAAKDNKELTDIFNADQADRSGDNIDWSQVDPRDKARQARVRQIIKDGGLHTPADYNHASFVFQHGDGLEDIRLAHALATISTTMAPDDKELRWIVAASWDRMLMYRNQAQWYGTQYKSDEQGWYLYPVAENAVTDADRQAMGVPTLAESQQRVAEIATSMHEKVRAAPPSLEEIRKAAEKQE